MEIAIKGYCPTQKKDYEVTTEVIETKNLSGTSYVKGLTVCDYIKFGEKCNYDNCPITDSYFKK